GQGPLRPVERAPAERGARRGRAHARHPGLGADLDQRGPQERDRPGVDDRNLGRARGEHGGVGRRALPDHRPRHAGRPAASLGLLLALARPLPLGPRIPGLRRPPRPDAGHRSQAVRHELGGWRRMMERRRTAMRKAVAVIGGLLAISQRGAAQAPPTQILRFAPIADTYVDSSAPATSFHASTRLRVNGSPARTSYLRFRVSGVNGRSVEHARLRLGVRNASGETGGTVHVITDGAWEESTLTYANRPAVDGPGLDTLGPVAMGAVVEFALDGAIVAPQLGLGRHTVTASVTNGAGLADAAQIRVTVRAAPAGNTPPLVAITAPNEGAPFTLAQAIPFRGTANDLEGGDLTDQLTWTSDRDGVIGVGESFSTTL